MKKYKVGDLVRVRADLVAGKRYRQEGEKEARCLATKEMAQLAGKVVTIGACGFPDRYHVVGSGWKWTDEMFAGPVNANKIVVTSDGETTTAKLFSGKDLVKSATAKCSKSDTFDFETGATLAIERLLCHEKKENELFPLEEIKAGYLLAVRDDDGSTYNMTVMPNQDDVLGCHSPQAGHYWPLSRFGEKLRYSDSEIQKIYGPTCNANLLSNLPGDRNLLWSRN